MAGVPGDRGGGAYPSSHAILKAAGAQSSSSGSRSATHTLHPPPSGHALTEATMTDPFVDAPEIPILLLGDPGVGKSTFLSYVPSSPPRALIPPFGRIVYAHGWEWLTPHAAV